ncbi:hypothetical protein DBV05_g11561 [Lasiodiplodia theobromae]|uniref:Uncharacterized protein n=1 Tax=Lasiodiplodia theobromae TaxID=45133 RepID=A0A5N5CWM7_9PEZI|nr:hypothetical protein DBV05_g11561 [Lasiodiplodia theobromae]
MDKPPSDAPSDNRSDRPATTPAGSSKIVATTNAPPAVSDVDNRLKSLRVLATVAAAVKADVQPPMPDPQQPGDQTQELQRPLQVQQAQQAQHTPQVQPDQQAPQVQQAQEAPQVQQAQEAPQVQHALQIQQAQEVQPALPLTQPAPQAQKVQQAPQAPQVEQAEEAEEAQESLQVQQVQQIQHAPQVQQVQNVQQTRSHHSRSHPYHEPNHSTNCGCCNLAADAPTYTPEEREMIAILTASWRARMVQEGRIAGDETGSAGIGARASQEGGEVVEEGGSATAAAGAAVGEGAAAAERDDDEGRKREEAAAAAGAEPEAMDWTPAEGETAQRVQQRQEEVVSSEDQQQSVETAAAPVAAAAAANIDDPPRHEAEVVVSDDEGTRTTASRATSEMTDAANRMRDVADNLRNIALLFGEAGGNAGIISAQPSSASNTNSTNSPSNESRRRASSKTPARQPGGGGSSPRRSHAPPRRSGGGASTTRGGSTPAATIATSSSNDSKNDSTTTTTTLSYGEVFRIAIDPAPFDPRIYTLLTPGAALLCERERYAEWWRRSFLIVQKEPPAGLPMPNDVSFFILPPEKSQFLKRERNLEEIWITLRQKKLTQQDPRARWRLDRQLTATWSEQECAPADGPVGTAKTIVEPLLDQQGRLRGLGAGGARSGRRAGSEGLLLLRTMATPTPMPTTAEAGQKQGGNNQRRNGKDGSTSG